MFTDAFTLDRHIEELRAELRGTSDEVLAMEIQAELEAALEQRDALERER